MRKLFSILFAVIFVVAGIVVIVMGVNRLNSKSDYDASTTGVIVGIEREWTGTDEDGFDQYNYTVYINYEVDGQKYENVEYPSYDSSMKKGDEVEVKFEGIDRALSVPYEKLLKVRPEYLTGDKKVIVGLRCEQISVDPEILKKSKK